MDNVISSFRPQPDYVLAVVSDVIARVASGQMSEKDGLMVIRQHVDNLPLNGEDSILITRYDPEHVPPEIPGDFPTGIVQLDRFLIGGVRRGELAYVSGGAKDGKTTFLITLGAHALQAGVKVTHCTLEIYTPVVQQRYSENFLRKPIGRITKKELSTITYSVPGALEIVEMVVSPNLQSIEYAIEQTKPDLLIVDYADYLHTKSDKRFSELGLVFEKLRALGRQYDCGVWTASEVNRQGEDGESYLKKYRCDLHVTLEVDPSTAQQGIASIFVDEIRRANGRYQRIPICYMPQIAYIGGD